MSKPRIHILGAGGPAGIWMTRCLSGDDRWTLSGWDDSPWPRRLVECDLSEDTDADIVIPVPDALVAQWAGLSNTFLPDKETVERCQDKAECARILGDLCARVEWVRDTRGAGGRGAQMAQEYLPGRNTSCELVYEEGILRAHFQKERLSYVTSRPEASVVGVGTSMVSRCIDDGEILELAMQAIKRVAGPETNGVFGVDFQEDEYGNPKVTEINPGRFLTASYVYYYGTGYNLPRLMVETALYLAQTKLPPYPEGIGIVRQLDSLPWIGKLHDERGAKPHAGMRGREL